MFLQIEKHAQFRGNRDTVRDFTIILSIFIGIHKAKGIKGELKAHEEEK